MRVTIWLVLLGICMSAAAETPIPPAAHTPVVRAEASPVPPPSNATSPTAARSSEDARRIDSLEAQLSVISEYNDDFLSLVVWSLSTVGAITIVLIGFNWFQSNRALKKEFDALQTELSQRLAADKVEMLTKIDAKLGELEKSIKQIAADAAMKHVGALKPRILELEFNAHEKDYEHWMEKAVPGNALTATREMLACSIEVDWDWRISSALECIHSVLDLARKGGKRMELQDLAEIEAVVATIPDSNKTARMALLKKLASLHLE